MNPGVHASRGPPTTTRAGLRVRAELDTGTYPPGAKISDEQMAALPLRRHDWHGDWDYCVARRSDIDPQQMREESGGYSWV